MLRIVPHSVPRVSRSCELFPDGFDLHLLHTRHHLQVVTARMPAGQRRTYDATLQAPAAEAAIKAGEVPAPDTIKVSTSWCREPSLSTCEESDILCLEFPTQVLL